MIILYIIRERSKSKKRRKLQKNKELNYGKNKLYNSKNLPVFFIFCINYPLPLSEINY